MEVPEWGDKKWIVVAGAFLVQLGSQGVSVSLSVLLANFVDEFQSPMSVTSFALNLPVVIMLLIGIVAGGLGDKHGFRPIGLFGGIVTALGLVIASFSTSLAFLTGFLSLAGLGTGLSGIASNAITPQYFFKKRALASGTMKSGAGAGQALLSTMAAVVAKMWNWRVSLIVNAGIVLCIVPLGLYPLKKPPLREGVVPVKRKVLDWSWFRNTGFRWWILFLLFMMSAFSGPTVYSAKAAEDMGMARIASSRLVLIIGIVSACFRPIMGFLSDIWGRMMMMGVSVGLIVLSGLLWVLGVKIQALMYVMAVIFGVGGAGTMSLLFPIMADQFSVDCIGSVIAMSYFGLATGYLGAPPVIGALYDRYGPVSVGWWTVITGLLSLPLLWGMHWSMSANAKRKGGRVDIVPQ